PNGTPRLDGAPSYQRRPPIRMTVRADLGGGGYNRPVSRPSRVAGRLRTGGVRRMRNGRRLVSVLAFVAALALIAGACSKSTTGGGGGKTASRIVWGT